MRTGLLVVLFAGFLASCGKPPVTGVSIDSEMQLYIPPNAQALLSIQMDKLKTSDVYKRHSKDLDLPELNALSERIGSDPRRDLSAALAIWDGKQAMFLAKGKFAPEQVQQKIQALGAPSVNYKNFTLFGSKGNAVVFVDSSLALSGPMDVLHAALDRKATGNGLVPPELAERMKGVSKDAQIWEVSRGGLPLAVFPMRSDVQSTLGNFATAISETSIGVHADSGLQLQADIQCVSKEGAQRVHDALRGLVGLARLTTNTSDMDLLRLWDAVHVEQDQGTVHLRADLSADLTEKLFTYLPQMKGRARQMARPF